MNTAQLNELSEEEPKLITTGYVIVKIHGICGLVTVKWLDTGMYSVISKDEVECDD